MLDIIDCIDLDGFDLDSVSFDYETEADTDTDCYEDSDDFLSDYSDLDCTTDFVIPEDFDISDNDINSLDSSSQIDLSDSTHETNSEHSHLRTSKIAFTGNGSCRICKCGGWAGFGDTCENCGHFYNKHI